VKLKSTQRVFYRAGYKYQLAETYEASLPFHPSQSISVQFITFERDGVLTIRSGYAWDGPSGPTFDTKNFMRGSLVHDVLYQLIRNKWLPEEFRAKADDLLKQHCLEDGMSKVRAWYVHRAVSRYAMSAADPQNAKKVYYAPRI
jgi:hypothetical protein